MKKHIWSTVAMVTMAIFAAGSVTPDNTGTGPGETSTPVVTNPKAPMTEEERQQEAAAKAAADAEAARLAEEELNVDGLVLLKKTVEGKANEFGIEITGTVVNRRNRTLKYAQISFNVYDASGAQVGSALANINGLEAGGRWNFKATAFGQKATSYKFSNLTGF